MRKMLSLLLALLMTVTVVPVEAFAADLPTTFDITNDSQFEDLKSYLAAGENNYAPGTEITESAPVPMPRGSNCSFLAV